MLVWGGPGAGERGVGWPSVPNPRPAVRHPSRASRALHRIWLRSPIFVDVALLVTSGSRWVSHPSRPLYLFLTPPNRSRAHHAGGPAETKRQRNNSYGAQFPYVSSSARLRGWPFRGQNRGRPGGGSGGGRWSRRSCPFSTPGGRVSGLTNSVASFQHSCHPGAWAACRRITPGAACLVSVAEFASARVFS